MTSAEKIKGIDMISGALAPGIFRFAVPIALTGILQQLFNAADLAVAGRFAGKEAMAAVGSNAPVIGVIVNLFVGIALGANIVIAQASGQKDGERISRAVHTSLVIAVIAGIVMGIVGELITGPVVALLGVPDDVYDMALSYLRIYLCGMPVILLYNFESAIFRSRGRTQIPLIALTISGIVNVVLNVFFVVGLHMGVEGVALATVISNLISSVILFGFLLRAEEQIRVHIRKLGIDRKILVRILKIGIPAGLQTMVFSLANIVVQSAINSLGSTVMAASSAAFNLEIIACYVMNSYGQACSTFVGQNYGAGKPERCRRILKLCLILDLVSTGTVFSLILIFGHQLLGIFTADEEVIAIGMIRLIFVFITYMFSFVMDVLSGYLRGFGISNIPAAASIFGICGTRFLWILFVFPKSPSFLRIMQIYPISLIVTTAVILVMVIRIRPSQRYMN